MNLLLLVQFCLDGSGRFSCHQNFRLLVVLANFLDGTDYSEAAIGGHFDNNRRPIAHELRNCNSQVLSAIDSRAKPILVLLLRVHALQLN